MENNYLNWVDNTNEIKELYKNNSRYVYVVQLNGELAIAGLFTIWDKDYEIIIDDQRYNNETEIQDIMSDIEAYDDEYERLSMIFNIDII